MFHPPRRTRTQMTRQMWCCVCQLLLILFWARQAQSREQLNGKKGIGFLLRENGQPDSWYENLPKVVKLEVSWNYSWGTTRPDLEPSFINFLPMIWGYYNDENALEQELRDILSVQNPKMIMAFNEPDHEDQSNLTVDEVLSAWPILESANVPLVSPSCANPLGDWMEKFMDEAIQRQYRVDIIGVHYYGGPDPHVFQTVLHTIHKLYQRPILVTEFAVADWQARVPEENSHSPREVLEFMKVVLPWMESQDWIVGYAWFPFNIGSPVGTSSALFDEDGNFTVCGNYYADWNAAPRRCLLRRS